MSTWNWSSFRVLLHLRACFKQVEATFMLKVSYMPRAAIGNAKLLVPG